MKVHSYQLIFICLLLSPSLMAQSKKNWKTISEWQETKYGAWGGSEVNPPPGPMDTILLKDYAPKSSVVSTVTFIPKARYPVIDAHSHNYAKTPEEVMDWIKTMDEVGIDMTVV